LLRIPFAVLVASCAAALVLPATATAAADARYCGNMTVRAATGWLHIEIDITRGRTSCQRARAVTAYAWSPRHRSRLGNKFLGDPSGWTCAVARATQPAVAGSCRRHSDGAVVTAYNRDYESE
jgi:hypothetical protein